MEGLEGYDTAESDYFNLSKIRLILLMRRAYRGRIEAIEYLSKEGVAMVKEMSRPVGRPISLRSYSRERSHRIKGSPRVYCSTM